MPNDPKNGQVTPPTTQPGERPAPDPKKSATPRESLRSEDPKKTAEPRHTNFSEGDS